MEDKKTCQNCTQPFTIEPDDFAFYEKIKVPPPTWCPRCRMQRRMVFRNERKLFHSTSALTGRKMLSLYPPESGYIIYHAEEWYSDEWDSLAYGQEVDFSRPFLSQMRDLLQKVPKLHAAYTSMINSEYCANAGWLKNCYLLFNSNYSEDSCYGNGIDHSRNCVDNSHVQSSELCYGSFWLTKCYQAHFSSRCEDCHSIWFCRDCRGCSDCFGCVNMRGKSYCWFNEQLSKEEYTRRVKEARLDLWSRLSDMQKKANAYWLTYPVKFLQGAQNTNVSGELISHSRNVKNSYLVRESENVAYSQYLQVPTGKDIYDATISAAKGELIYESSVCGWTSSRLKFCWECWEGNNDLDHCMFCHGASDSFGSIGLHKKQFCILNKQYAKEDYETLREKIIRHMNDMPYVDQRGRVYKYGEFFPPEFAPFGYNITIAQEHVPLTKEEAIQHGFRWQDTNPTEYQATMDVKDIPDSVNDIRETILKEIIQCANCKRAYRLIASELQFLKQNGIPAPRTCVDCRHDARIAQRNRAEFYHRKCMNQGCPNEFETSYSPDRPEIVYCESCYQQEVV